MELSVFFAGTAGSVPSARRGLPALLVRYGAQRILIDCGEGTQRQLVRSVGLADLTDVFITHLHADHWLGLPGMLKSFDLRDRDKPLVVHGPPGLRETMSAMHRIVGRTRYELSVMELEPGEAVRREELQIHPVEVKHRGRAYGYAIVENPRAGRFDAELAAKLGVEFGPDFGRLQRGEKVNGVSPDQVIGKPREGRKLVLSGDTEPCEAIRIAAHQADLLVHEATFGADDEERARQSGHSTAHQAAQLAADAEVRLLALTHVSARYLGGELREEARGVFARTEVPRDFDQIEIPFPERGPATLTRAGAA